MVKFGYIKSKLGTILGVTPFYPIGYIIEETSGINPSKWYGGTWELYGKGRVTACIDTDDQDSNVRTSFNQISGKTLGSKWLQRHGHIRNTHTCSVEAGGYGLVQSPSFYNRVEIEGGIGGYNTSDSGDGDAQNIQPTILVYRWRKVSF